MVKRILTTLAAVISAGGAMAAPVIDTVAVTADAAGTPVAIRVTGSGLCEQADCTGNGRPVVALGSLPLAVSAATPEAVVVRLDQSAAVGRQRLSLVVNGQTVSYEVSIDRTAGTAIASYEARPVATALPPAAAGEWVSGVRYAAGAVVTLGSPVAGAATTCVYVARNATTLPEANPYYAAAAGPASAWFSVTPGCVAQPQSGSVVVAGGPAWLAAANPGLYAFGSLAGAAPPAVVELAPRGYGPGSVIYLQCAKGAVYNRSRHAGISNSCAAYSEAGSVGEPGQLASNAASCLVDQPMVAFVDADGAVKGAPFCISSAKIPVAVPAGATRLQFGINETDFAALVGASFTVTFAAQ